MGRCKNLQPDSQACIGNAIFAMIMEFQTNLTGLDLIPVFYVIGERVTINQFSC